MRLDVSKLSEIAKGNATKNQEWQRKLRDTPVTTALETIPTVNITETNALIYATVRALQESVGQKGSRAAAGEEDQAIEIRCQQTQ